MPASRVITEENSSLNVCKLHCDAAAAEVPNLNMQCNCQVSKSYIEVCT
jgi:hypothetical protein